ncbi:response regulator transcription factor [Paenibacillus sp. OAS669]|uniref:response regulator transcription factor n=1 Tax=Paenibacillus sp. OAS669 TaxID=2663821 RepID=UPI00178B22F8|nr:response regulator transcription factor [Paenibacillus sp. OAS669]MBE1446838.1 DNA-binding response OmpR family regulator [Paenibacillus sp. OAS669]
MKKVLLIEDEKNLAMFIELELQHEAFSVTVANDGREGVELALGQEWDMILLDIMLPGLDGLEVCRRVRSVKNTPIIMLTARDSVVDRVSGLDSGADDYIPKPFAIEELLARMRSLLRRVDMADEPEARQLISFGDIAVDMEARRVMRGDEPIELTKREFDLLAIFVQNPNIVMSRDVLLEKIWGFDSEVETNVVDVYVRYLRNKLDPNGRNRFIETVRGIGYVMR